LYTPRTIYLGKYENEKYNMILSRVDQISTKYQLMKNKETTFIQPENTNAIDSLFQHHMAVLEPVSVPVPEPEPEPEPEPVSVPG
jgi:hypothetical protein